MSILDFGFLNPYVPAAFLVAGILCGFKMQFQALLYLLTVIYACQSLNQFVLVNLVLVLTIVVSKFFNAAADRRGG